MGIYQKTLKCSRLQRKPVQVIIMSLKDFMNEAEKGGRIWARKGTECSGMLQCCGNGISVLLLEALSRLLYKAGNESTP